MTKLYIKSEILISFDGIYFTSKGFNILSLGKVVNETNEQFDLYNIRSIATPNWSLGLTLNIILLSKTPLISHVRTKNNQLFLAKPIFKFEGTLHKPQSTIRKFCFHLS